MSLMKTKLFFILLLAIGCAPQAVAQDLLSKLSQEQITPEFNTQATFKATRISIGHSVETRKRGVLEISAMNRFWNDPDKSKRSFLADKLNTRIGVEYGVSDRLTIGVGYGTGYRSWDVFAKYRLFFQRDSGKKFPFSITLFQNGVHRNKETFLFLPNQSFEDELAFSTQLLIARKITSNFSLQVAPSYIYRAEDGFLESESTSRFAIGFGGRYKIGKHVSVVSEYYYVPNPFSFVKTYGAFSVGANWEIADVMLQFKLTNARNFVEDKFIVKTANNFNFKDGNLHFGFHATYVIHFFKRKIRNEQ